MIKRLLPLLFILIFTQNFIAKAEEIKYIEIFDPKQDKVVKVLPLNKEFQDIVVDWIKNIDSIYGRFNPLTDDGYAIRVPLERKVAVHNDLLKAEVEVVYILIPETAAPFFMIFEDEIKVTCFSFNGDIDVLSKYLDFNLPKCSSFRN